MDKFKSAECISGVRYVEDKSEFISFAYYCDGEYKDRLKYLKAEYPDATHICYAYRYFDKELMLEKGQYREYANSNDAGEPSGTAGMPILNAIKSAEANNVLVCVVRYFGGNKLGASNLARAYNYSASLALQDTVEYSLSSNYEIKVNYSQYNQLCELQNKGVISIVESKFDSDIDCVLQVKNSDLDMLKRAVPELILSKTGQDYMREVR